MHSAQDYRDYQQLPDSEDIQLAKDGSSELSKLLSERPETDHAEVTVDGHEMILPRQVILMLRDLLTSLAKGNAVNIMPMHIEITTQEAADILNVSRPFLIKQLEQGKLPFTKVGTHRRIRCDDLFKYKNKLEKQSRKAMDELVQQAQQDKMGY
ncbi:MAG: helix-turn-helix domain-containing protein [Gammaproteobacteria bacterium]|nr:helix-turn-helix domain-containing protein [Gammaproteobacteria bacterium]MYD77005.1 helix-turn-helix domain-containing protein [Gammaproteobacteria bacterium]MYJ52469.1 helix-turn-helix domain-containing protein [Gammaproteobacteria bacterium]